MVTRTSLREQVRNLLLQRIGSGELAPKDRIVEAKLAVELGVSSIPVREAIRELVAMGVLESTTHKTATVREVGTMETIEALQVRSCLEPLAVSLGGTRLQSRCAELRDAAKGIIASAQARDYDSYQRHNQTFHRTIVEGSGNGVLLKVWNSLAFEVRAKAIHEHMLSADPMEVARDHMAIVDALDAGETAAAAALLASHCWHLVEYLRREMVSQEEENQVLATV